MSEDSGANSTMDGKSVISWLDGKRIDHESFCKKIVGEPCSCGATARHIQELGVSMPRATDRIGPSKSAEFDTDFGVGPLIEEALK